MPNPGFTLAEDAALKDRLRTLTVSDDRDASREVEVFFRYPEGEKEKTYPFITIELLDIAHALPRQESERSYYYASEGVFPDDYDSRSSLTYWPSEMTAADLEAYTVANGADYLVTEQLIPVDLIYQVTTYCRSQRHDRQLTANLMRYVFPWRQTSIEVAEDGTYRRCELLDWQQSDLLDQEAGYKKRIFRKVLTVRINSELTQTGFTSVLQVLSVDGTLTEHEPNNPVAPTFSEDF